MSFCTETLSLVTILCRPVSSLSLPSCFVGSFTQKLNHEHYLPGTLLVSEDALISHFYAFKSGYFIPERELCKF